MKKKILSISRTITGTATLIAAATLCVPVDGLAEAVSDVPFQPLKVHATQLAEALQYLGAPISRADAKFLAQPVKEGAQRETVERIQKIFDPLCLVNVSINPESRVKVEAGPAAPELVEKDWRLFLIKVHNEAGVTASLNVTSPQEMPESGRPWNQPAGERWLKLKMHDGRPLAPKLGGIPVEYRLIYVYADEAGDWSAVLQFDVGQGTQDLGFRSDLVVNFKANEVAPLQLSLLDEHGKPTTAALEFRDEKGRVFPAQGPKLAPDFPFHPQIYRSHGQRIAVPVGKWTVRCRRGPEYVEQLKTIEVSPEMTALSFQLERWIDPSELGWWSGDHHIHAAGCQHYTVPTRGVHPGDMILHCRGEDLKVGATLTWGPGFDYQKQFFTGREDDVSKYPYLLRYDVEVSGFGSHRSGHLCLLLLSEQVYPGGDSKHHWPTLCLNTLKWAQKQGAVAGPAHSGWGLAVESNALPNYIIPPFDGIGANEYIVDVTHRVPGPDGTTVPAVDFLSMVDTPYVWELNIWYHTLNCGYRTRISGESDFPCIYGERVGIGRGYFKVDGKLTYDKWCNAIARGRGYVGDGFSHLIDFTVQDVEVGSKGSVVALDRPGKVKVKAKVAARLDPREGGLETVNQEWLVQTAGERLAGQSYSAKPYWHIERARVKGTREVDVEVIVNGYPAATKRIVADGELLDLEFDVEIERSSWVAMRILPSSHTNPVFVTVGDEPIRASTRSAEWCLKSVDKCWEEKEKFIAPEELEDAKKAYAHARRAYQRILKESVAE